MAEALGRPGAFPCRVHEADRIDVPNVLFAWPTGEGPTGRGLLGAGHARLGGSADFPAGACEGRKISLARGQTRQPLGLPLPGSASVESDDTGTRQPSRNQECPISGLQTGRPPDRFT